MSIQKRKFSKEFKIQIIHEIENGTPVAQISRQHEIQESLIHKWRKLFSALASLAPRPERNQQNPANAFSGNGKISSQVIFNFVFFMAAYISFLRRDLR